MLSIAFKDKLYLYTIKSTVYEENLCKMEMKYLFNKLPENGCLFSDYYVEPYRSAFIKQCISIIYTGNTLEEIVSQIINDNLSYEDFKVSFINIEEDVAFQDRRRAEYIIGYNINGFADIHNPKVLLGVTKINDKWIFGRLEENKTTWLKHNHKPYSYSNALGVRVARALVNIAVCNNLKLRLIDPCCGVGTVVMEALNQGINIKGCDINPLVAESAKKNLKFFGYEDVITNEDMHNIKQIYDAAIVDLPYGLFSIVTLEEQLNIIKDTRRIAKKGIFITYDDMEKYFISLGFTIMDKCHVDKGSLKRYITVCS